MRPEQHSEIILKTQEELDDRLAYWQQRLRLQDWVVVVEMVRGHEIPGYVGRVEITLNNKQAKIRLTDPVDYDPASMFPYDMEATLIHELLHLHFYPLTKELGEDTAEEQAIESIVSALVATERKIR